MLAGLLAASVSLATPTNMTTTGRVGEFRVWPPK
jgi:hypothetical protein